MKNSKKKSKKKKKDLTLQHKCIKIKQERKGIVIV